LHVGLYWAALGYKVKLVMAKPSHKKQLNQSKNIYKPKILRPAFLFYVIVMAILAIWLGLMPLFVDSKDKGSLKHQMQSVVDGLNFPNQMLYSAVTDQGCRSNAVMFQTDISCSMSAYVYFRNNTNLSTDLHAIDRGLTDQGWEVDLYEGQSISDAAKILEGIDFSQIRYVHKDSDLSLILGFYRKEDGRHQGVSGVEGLIAQGTAMPLKEDEYIYGVSLNESYWRCSEPSIPGMYCKFPPGELN